MYRSNTQNLSKKERLALWKKRQATLLRLVKRYGYICWYCGDPFTSFKEVQVDHIVPRVNGGSDRINNLAIACIKCNQAKAWYSLDEFLEWLMKEKKPVAYITNRASQKA